MSYYEKRRRPTSYWMWWVIAVGVMLAAYMALVGFGSGLTWVIETGRVLAVPALVIGVFAGLAAGTAKVFDLDAWTSAYVGAGIGVVVAIVVLVGGSWTTMNRNYDGVEVADVTAMPELAARTPYPVARELLQRNTGGLTGELIDVTYVVNHPSGSPKWTGVIAGSTFVGMQGIVEWDDSTNEFTVCEFNGAASPNGIFMNSLKRKIRDKVVNSWFRNEDLYGICGQDGPVLYWPYARKTGLYSIRFVPGGVVTVNTDGNISVDSGNIEPGIYPGPVVPMRTVRDSVNANRSTLSWSGSTFAARNYYVATGLASGDAASGDVADPNVVKGNYREFLMTTVDGEMVFVTPLSVVGSDPSTRAIAIVKADRLTVGQMPTTTIVELSEAMPSPAEVDQSIRSQLPNLGWAAGLTVIEVTPQSAEIQTATLGFDLKITTTVSIDNNGNVEIIGETNDSTTVNEGESPAADISANGSTELGNMSNDELYELLGKISDELSSR